MPEEKPIPAEARPVLEADDGQPLRLVLLMDLLERGQLAPTGPSTFPEEVQDDDLVLVVSIE